MTTDISYFPHNGCYFAVPTTIYAQYLGNCPDPCRKYHISSAVDGAERVAAIVLPFLAARAIMHKVVKSRALLEQQMKGKQAGKFITVYMQPDVGHRNALIMQLGALLAQAYEKGLIHPSPEIPKSRPYANLFMETPLDRIGFVWGGSVVDPKV